MATHSNILAWEIPWTEEPGGCSPWGCKKVEHDLATKQQQPSWVHLFIHEPNQALILNRWLNASGPGDWDCVPVPDHCCALTI